MEYYQSPSNKKHLSKRDFAFIKLVVSWAIAIAIAFSLHQFVFQSYQVFGASMEPSLHEGDYLIISKLGPTWSNLRNSDYVPERGDIIVFKSDDTRLIKRVIGLPGETVSVDDGRVEVINDEHPRGFDPYEKLDLPSDTASGSIHMRVPEDQVFVIGDNRSNSNSLDSRNQLGNVPTEDVVGSLVIRLWPPEDIDTF